ncbi:hypothetical protein KC901_03510 [Patescibacteria group bacterium]|nr:hypothetical protein [Patescibacteria group bacterium]
MKKIDKFIIKFIDKYEGSAAVDCLVEFSENNDMLSHMILELATEFLEGYNLSVHPNGYLTKEELNEHIDTLVLEVRELFPSDNVEEVSIDRFLSSANLNGSKEEQRKKVFGFAKVQK